MENEFHVIIIHYRVGDCKTRNETEKRNGNGFWIRFILDGHLKLETHKSTNIFLEYRFSQSILAIYSNKNRFVFVSVASRLISIFVCFISFRSVSLLFSFLFYNHPYLVSHADQSIIWILMGSIMDYMNPTWTNDILACIRTIWKMNLWFLQSIYTLSNTSIY